MNKLDKQNIKVKKQLLIIIVLILLIAIIGFNFEKITGGVIKHQYPIVKVYKSGYPQQNEVKAGDKVTVQVQVGDYCVSPELSFYFSGVTYAGEKKSAGPRLATATKKGSSRICKGDTLLDSKNTFTVDYRTSPVWDGDYYARVYFWKDRTTKDYLNVYFKVKPS